MKSTNIVFAVAFALFITGCSPSGQDATTASQPDTSQPAFDTIAQDFEPKYVGGYPTNETVEAMFEEYDYKAAFKAVYDHNNRPVQALNTRTVYLDENPTVIIH